VASDVIAEPLAEYLTLLAWSGLAASILPLASEPVLAAVVLRQQTLLVPVAIATVGNYVGAASTYWLARGIAGKIAPHADEPRGRRTAAAVLNRFGQPALLLSWVPLLGDALVASAGALCMPFWRFSLWTFAGKLARYAVVAWLALEVT
jgi:membrane protein YqaA with SNARE-associated domain